MLLAKKPLHVIPINTFMITAVIRFSVDVPDSNNDDDEPSATDDIMTPNLPVNNTGRVKQ